MESGALYGRLAEFYDGIYQFRNTKRETRESVRIASQCLGGPPRSLLDVACGTGVHLEEFRKTMAVSGVDLSRDMLRVARKRLGKGVPLKCADMRTFKLATRFDVLTCLFSAIGHLQTRRDRDLAIANFYHHLVPGGVALVEGWVLPQFWRGTAVDLDTYTSEDCRVARVASSRREGDMSIVDFQWLIARRGEKIEHFTETMRNPLVDSEEMLGSFRRAGFRARAVQNGTHRVRALYVGVRPRGRSRTRS